MEKSMLAAVFKGEGKLVLEERPVPRITKPDEVLLAVKGVGVCGTDLHILEVPPRHPATKNVIMGHEFTGEVLETGKEVTNCKPGDHVAVDQNAACGHCEECRRGYPNTCLTVLSAPVPGFSNTPGIFQNGALAKYIVIPDYLLYPIQKSIPWHHAAITETVACAFNALRKGKPEFGETALVLGAGPIGLLLTIMVKSSGAKVITAEVSEYRSRVAKKVGADRLINPQKENLVEAVMDETDGKGADVVFEAVGPLLNECILTARFGGRVLLFGHDELARPQVPQAAIMRKELQITGVFLTKYTFIPAINLLSKGLLPMDDIVSHVLPLEQILEAHEMLKAGKAIKIVITP